MPFTAEDRTDIIALTVGVWNAAPGAANLNDLSGHFRDGGTLLELTGNLVQSDVFRNEYPTLLTPREFYEEFVGKLLGDHVSREDRDWAVDYLVGRENAGASRAEVILAGIAELRAVPEDHPDFGDAAAAFNNRIEVAGFYSVELEKSAESVEDLKEVIAGVDETQSSVEKALENMGPRIPPVSFSYVLTNQADAITGAGSDDVFVSDEASLSSADVLDGGDGTDTLRYASSGSSAVSESGFEVNNVERVQVTSDATGGTSFDMTGVTDLETVRNFNSSSDLTLTGVGTLANVELANIGSDGTVAPDTTVNYQSGVAAGSSDEIDVMLDGNLNSDGSGIGNLTANGVETFNVTTSGAASNLDTLVSSSLDTVNVDGDQNLTLRSNLAGATTVDASGLSGDVDIIADSGNEDVAVTGGSGDDTVDFSNGWDAGDRFNGGAGDDSLALDYATATSIAAGNSGSASNVETLLVVDGATGTATIGMDHFDGVSEVRMNGGVDAGATVTLDNAASGLTTVVNVENAAGSVVVDLAADGNREELDFSLDSHTQSDSIASLSAADAETLGIDTQGLSQDDAVINELTISSLTATSATTLNLSGDAGLTIADTVDPAVAVLDTIDASGMSGDLALSGTDLAPSGAGVTLGGGDDTFNVASAPGADTFTLGDGEDTVVYTAVTQSDSDMDTITDFVPGTDRLDLSNLTGDPASGFAGNRPDFARAQGALAGEGTPGDGYPLVFQSDEQILWADVNDDGTLDNNDFRVKLAGVTEFGSGGNTIELTGNRDAELDLTTAVNATATATRFDDTIHSRLDALTDSNVDAGPGRDTLILTDAVSSLPAPAGFTFTFNDFGVGGDAIVGIEVLRLADGDNNIAFNGAGDFRDVIGGPGDDIVDAGNLSAGGSIDLGAGDDTLKHGGQQILRGGDGNDTLELAAGDDLSGVSLDGFENLTLTSNGIYTMTTAQYESLNDGTVTAAGGEVLSITDGGTLNAVAPIEDYSLSASDNTINVGVAADNAYSVTAESGDDTLNLDAGWDVATDSFAGDNGSDTVNINHDLGGANLATSLSSTEVINVTAGQTGALGIDDSINTAGGLTLDASSLDSDLDIANTADGSNGDIVIRLGAGDDRVTAVRDTGGGATEIHFGAGSDALVDILAPGGSYRFHFGVSGAGDVDNNSIDTNNADLASGDAISVEGVDFAALATSMDPDNSAGTAVVQDQGADTLIRYDANGNGTLDAGQDLQITITGQNLEANMNLTSGDLVVV